MKDQTEPLLRQIRWLTAAFILGLFLSGVTAIPLRQEVGQLLQLAGGAGSATNSTSTPLVAWLEQIHTALQDVAARQPFLFYGTDWLAFGHFMIAIVFIGAWRDPVRNCWLFDFGLIACALVIPYAFCFGALRGIPVWWRLVDCSFGVFGAIPLWWCRRLVGKLELLEAKK